MNKKRFLTIIMTVMMMLSLLPASVFAAEGQGGLEGKLKVRGSAAVGSMLEADLNEVKPQGLESDDVNYQWYRKAATEADIQAGEGAASGSAEDYQEDQMTSVGTGSTYQISEEDWDCVIVLKITPSEALGIGGSLYAKTAVVTEASDGTDMENDPQYDETEGMTESGQEASQGGDEAAGGQIPQEEAPLDPEQGDDLMPIEDENEPVQEPEIPDEGEETWNNGVDPLDPDGDQQDDWYTYDDEILDPVAPDENLSGEENQDPQEGQEPQPSDDPQVSGEPEPSDVPSDDPQEENKYVLGTDLLEKQLQFNIEMTDSYSGSDYMQRFSIFNKGTEPLHITGVTVSGNYTYSENVVGTTLNPVPEGQESLEDNSNEYLMYVQPADGLEPGVYSETMTITTQEGAQLEILLNMNITKVEEPVYQLSVDMPQVDFGSVEQNVLVNNTPQQTITVTNLGNQNVTLDQPYGNNFWVGDLTATELAPGESAKFTVSPSDALAADKYEETITITDSQQKASANVVLKINVLEDAYYELLVDPSQVDFGTASVGYQPPEIQTVTITNNGNQTVELIPPTASSYRIGKLSASTLKPGASAIFRIQPKKDLQTGTYNESITIATADGKAAALVQANFAVQGNVLVSVQNPGPVSNLANGTEKSVQAMGLPGKVAIQTTQGASEAAVAWNLDGSSYDPASTSAQNFTVAGTITLPKGVTNPNKVSLGVTIQVTVQGYNPKIADPANNQITGVDTQNGYAAGAQIDFTAVGAGMDNVNPRKGDVRYVPLNWTVKNTYAWQQAPYTGAFKMSLPGDYSLAVAFNRQVFDGSNWTADGQQDVKRVNIRVYQVLTPTPGAAQNSNNDGTKKAGVATGDNTPIFTWIVVLLVAAICVAAGILYMKKRGRK